jgi:hypothetical protein
VVGCFSKVSTISAFSNQFAVDAQTRRDDQEAAIRRSGVSEYWSLIQSSTSSRCIEWASLTSRWLEFTIRKGDPLTTPLIPGLDLLLEEIFREG